MDRTPRPMEQYVHFKGGRYQVLNLAEMEETGEMLVIYQALYGEGRIYARPLSSFVSEVDRTKYPSAGQRWRFLRVVPPEEDREDGPDGPSSISDIAAAAASRDPFGETAGTDPTEGLPESAPTAARKQACVSGPDTASGPSASVQPAGPSEEEAPPAPAVLQFLEARTADEKLGVIAAARGTLTDDMIDTMAFALGIEIEPGPIDSRYLDLRECLLTISRYEMDRGRFRSTLT